MEQKDLEAKIINMFEKFSELKGRLEILSHKLDKLEKVIVFLIKVLVIQGIMLIISNVELAKKIIQHLIK